MISPRPPADWEGAAVAGPSLPGAAPGPLWRNLGPLCAVVFLEFLAMGLPLPVLPVHVHKALGLGMFAVGLVITGALSWGIALAGRERSGIVMSWVGIAMYGALAIGSPLGSSLASRFGFAGMSAATALSPLIAFGALTLIRKVDPVGGPRLPFPSESKPYGAFRPPIAARRWGPTPRAST